MLLRESKKNYFANLSGEVFQKTNAFENRQTAFVKAIHFPERINLTEEEKTLYYQIVKKLQKTSTIFFECCERSQYPNLRKF